MCQILSWVLEIYPGTKQIKLNKQTNNGMRSGWEEHEQCEGITEMSKMTAAGTEKV